jgi:hypothetical protein
METSSAGEGPLNLGHLSDYDLVQLLPIKKERGDTRDPKDLSVQERLALDELWKRHCEEVERNLRAKIFECGSTLCPEREPSKEHFLQMCLNEAYPAFLRRVGRLEYENFGGFVFTLVLNIARDVRNEIIENMSKIIDADDNTDLLVDQGRTPPQVVADHELRKIMKEVIIRHAKESPLSANLVIHRTALDLTWKEIAEKRVPEGVLGNSLRTRIRAAQAFYRRDRARLLRLLHERQITDPDSFKI